MLWIELSEPTGTELNWTELNWTIWQSYASQIRHLRWLAPERYCLDFLMYHLKFKRLRMPDIIHRRSNSWFLMVTYTALTSTLRHSLTITLNTPRQKFGSGRWSAPRASSIRPLPSPLTGEGPVGVLRLSEVPWGALPKGNVPRRASSGRSRASMGSRPDAGPPPHHFFLFSIFHRGNNEKATKFIDFEPQAWAR